MHTTQKDVQKLWNLNFDNFFNFNQVEFSKLVLTLNFYKWRR